MATSQLSDFLGDQRARFLQDVAVGKGDAWTVVMGNEAGDMDSAASSIGYAYLEAMRSRPESGNIIPLIQSTREDIPLRPENVHAFEQARLRSDWTDLLCLDDVPMDPFPSQRFVLLDHNRLADRYKSPGKEANVVAIFDHHADEGLHLTASPRVIEVPTGSAASLVTRHFRESPAWAPELAALLLSAIVIDTAGLKRGGKGTPTDQMAANILLALTTGESSLTPDDIETILKPMEQKLQYMKLDISRLSNRDLLRRDYKQYEYSSPNNGSKTITVGLSTVPLDLKAWVHKDPDSLLKFMNERNLMIHGSLTTFRRVNKEGKAKHKKQQLWVMREDVSKQLEQLFWDSLEADEDLELEKMKHFEAKLGLGQLQLEGIRMKAFKQGNVAATRKVVAPLVKQIVEKFLVKL